MEEFTTREGDVDELDLMPAGAGCAGRNAGRTDGTVVRTTIADVISDEARDALSAGIGVILLSVRLRAFPAPAGQEGDRVLLQWKMATDLDHCPGWIVAPLWRIEEACDDFDRDFPDRAIPAIVSMVKQNGGSGVPVWELTIRATDAENPGAVDRKCWINPMIRDIETFANINHRFDAIQDEIDPVICRLMGGYP